MDTSTTSCGTKSATSTTCKYVNRVGGCRFGEKCRYRHDHEADNKETNTDDVKTIQAFEILPKKYFEDEEICSEQDKSVLDRSHDNKGKTQPKPRKPVCRNFHRSGYCRFGEKCRFLHKTRVEKSVNKTFNTINREIPEKGCSNDQVIIEESPVQNKMLGFIGPTGQAHVSKPRKRPEHLSEKLSELSLEDVKYLQEIELEQLKKRFNDSLKINYESYGTICMFTIKPSDPDWPYDINKVSMNITFPDNYPREIFQAEIIDDDGLFPPYFTEYINDDIAKHLKEHADAQKLRDSSDLLFRPFLRWLDRNLEDLFTKALKQVEAQAAGLQFITFDNKVVGGSSKEETELSNPNDKQDLESNLENVKTSASQFDAEDKEVDSKPESVMFEMIEAKKTHNSKKGTEIRFQGMELHENTATVRIKSLFFTVQCGRCKNKEEMPNCMENMQMVLPCSKCSNDQSITITSSEIVHQNSTTVAYMDPQGCLPVDLILSECELIIGCLNCSKDTSTKGITYGSTKNVWCNHCHQKLDMKIETARFYQLRPDIALVSGEKIKRVQLQKTTRNKDPPIKHGQALPENGTCKHYKKSYRWMRFPCCGKCYPCDKCHEDAEREHDMEQATRMICGHCSKEQPFSQNNCVSCKSSMTAIHTSHWEGGKGCRNKIKMSRGDDKKYSDKNKTISRHAIKVDSQKKK
ncbi:uncharacterized protein LOC114529384 isoform X2 [Dendronephthya gigantea]|uniref:uncharacterized protein LOC114529384 isoform X2 n=1 Tax=Dendronephthya gigantea TaxID=151771 RepID=UPI00106C1F2D|nr:uncharacterized protein LOC114529384 isoform X2 [Dendronephthya gigantea]